jgi:hypothetical protein
VSLEAAVTCTLWRIEPACSDRRALAGLLTALPVHAPSVAGAERDAALRGVSDEQLWGTRVHEGTAAPKKE